MTPKEFAQLAQLAYTSAPDIGVEDSAARAIVVGDVVAFPGTNNPVCFLADLDADAIMSEEFGHIHDGFHKAFDSIRAPLMALGNVQAVTGHSLGAALALLYAAALCLAGKPPKEVHAFEPPHVSCDDTLAGIFAAHEVAVHIYRKGEDIIPMIPRILHDWRHPAPVISIGAPTWPIWNIEDHALAGIIESLS